jgi:hypothetical protein
MGGGDASMNAASIATVIGIATALCAAGSAWRMTIETTSGDWSPTGSAPRDGTPVILWLVEDETPPVLPLTVGFWTVNPQAGVGYWRIFGDPPRFYADRQIRGWRQLLQG